MTTVAHDKLAEEGWQEKPAASKLADLYHSTVRQQSSPVASRTALLAKVAQLQRSLGTSIAPPGAVSSLRLIPNVIELWVGSQDRLHDRQLYRLSASGWSAYVLVPEPQQPRPTSATCLFGPNKRPSVPEVARQDVCRAVARAIAWEWPPPHTAALPTLQRHMPWCPCRFRSGLRNGRSLRTCACEGPLPPTTKDSQRRSRFRPVRPAARPAGSEVHLSPLQRWILRAVLAHRRVPPQMRGLEAGAQRPGSTGSRRAATWHVRVLEGSACARVP